MLGVFCSLFFDRTCLNAGRSSLESPGSHLALSVLVLWGIRARLLGVMVVFEDGHLEEHPNDIG